MKKLPTLLILMGLGGSVVFADPTGVGYTHTTGSHGFDATTIDGNVQMPKGYFIGGFYNDYHADDSSGTIRTYGGRLGRDTDDDSLSLFGSVTPEVGSFKASSIGLDFRTAFIGRGRSQNAGSTGDLSSPDWAAIPLVSLIGGYTRSMATDNGQNADSNDLTGGLGLNVLKTDLSATYTKDFYDHSFTETPAPNPGLVGGLLNTTPLTPTPRRFAVGYSPSVFRGYPDSTVDLNAKQSLLPGWWLTGSYAHVKYKAGPDEKADLYTVGTNISLLHFVTLEFTYTRYNPSNTDNQNFYAFGGGVRF